jgi:hypothetical protein
VWQGSCCVTLGKVLVDAFTVDMVQPVACDDVIGFVGRHLRARAGLLLALLVRARLPLQLYACQQRLPTVNAFSSYSDCYQIIPALPGRVCEGVHMLCRVCSEIRLLCR